MCQDSGGVQFTDEEAFLQQGLVLTLLKSFFFFFRVTQGAVAKLVNRWAEKNFASSNLAAI